MDAPQDIGFFATESYRDFTRARLRSLNATQKELASGTGSL